MSALSISLSPISSNSLPSKYFETCRPKAPSGYYFMDKVGLVSEYSERYRVHTPGWFGGTTREYQGHNVFHSSQ